MSLQFTSKCLRLTDECFRSFLRLQENRDIPKMIYCQIERKRFQSYSYNWKINIHVRITTIADIESVTQEPLKLRETWLCSGCAERISVCVLIPRGFNEGSQTQVVVIWFWRLVQQMGRGWPEVGVHYIAPSFKRVGVCAQRALLSVFRQTDSWSNRLRRAVGSLGYDLSPLGPLHSSLVNSKFKTILIVLWLGDIRWSTVFICPNGGLKSFLWHVKATDTLKKSEKHFHVLPCAKVFKSLCVVVIECDGVCCEGRGPLALPLCVCVWVCVV